MSLELHRCILTENDCYQAGRPLAPKGIMIHSTGADNPYLRRYVGPDDGTLGPNPYGNHWNGPGVGACVHAFIGLDARERVQVYQTLPWTMRSWHCGAEGNDTHLSFEICEDDLTDLSYFEATREAALELCAHLCRLFGLDPLGDGVILDHKEGSRRGIASSHGDIAHWWSRFGYGMDEFRRDLAELLREPAPPTRQEVVDLIERAKPRRYDRVEDMPPWARPTVQALVDSGALVGDGKGRLNLTEDMLRLLVIQDRREKS